MSKPNVDQKKIFNLLSDSSADFLIPDYQRPYAWTEEQCQILWDDIFEFAFPNGNHEDFDKQEEYFLGSVVAFRNESRQFEIIDGQQRLTTFMLLLRAFYNYYNNMKHAQAISLKNQIEKCLWKTDEFGQSIKTELKITSDVATDDDKEEFLEILRTGNIDTRAKSQYAINFRFFEKLIQKFLTEYPSYFDYMPARILMNCAVLFVEADTQDTALRIFSTLNDRGLPLSDADIFKSILYKTYKEQNQKDFFIEQWQALEEITESIFKSNNQNTTPMDELFTKYMYYLRARSGVYNTTTDSLRNWYRTERFKYLKESETLSNLKALAIFWQKIHTLDNKFFPDDTLRELTVLKNSPNGMWEYLVSVYFLVNRDENNNLKMDTFSKYLSRISIFIMAYNIIRPGIGALRVPAFKEMVNIFNQQNDSFENEKIEKTTAKAAFENFEWYNGRPITRSLLTWWAFENQNQILMPAGKNLQIEHIFSKKRADLEGISDQKLIESLGNKILLETSINIKASDYHFEDKKKFYLGKINRDSENPAPSQIAEISEISKFDDFDEEKIAARKKKIIDHFFEKLAKENFLQ